LSSKFFQIEVRFLNVSSKSLNVDISLFVYHDRLILLGKFSKIKFLALNRNINVDVPVLKIGGKN
jgi:hypothetical protein